jgi:iron complex transport system substrate-binding protein
LRLALAPAFAGVTVIGCSGPQPIAPNGIVSNNPCIDSILSEIAAPGQIAAISHYSHDAQSGSAPLGWARSIPAVGTSAEEIIAARPRLVLTGNLASSGTNAALTKAGIRTVAMGVPATLAENDAQIRIVAKAINHVAAGEALIARINASLAPVTVPERELSLSNGGTVREGQSPERRTALIWQTGGFVAGAGTLQDELLTRAGYINAAARYGLKQWDALPLEAVLRAPPDVIFMPSRGKGDEARALERRAAVLRHLRKVRIVDFPDKLLFCGGPTVIKVMAALR